MYIVWRKHGRVEREDLLENLGFKSCSDALQFVLKMQVTYLVDLFSHLQIVILNVYLRNVLEEQEMLLTKLKRSDGQTKQNSTSESLLSSEWLLPPPCSPPEAGYY